MAQSQSWQWIPTHLSLEQFEEFVLPHLSDVNSNGLFRVSTVSHDECQAFGVKKSAKSIPT